MTRVQLEHIIRAAAANADTEQIVVIGSQSILGSHPEITHASVCSSMEADVFPLGSPERSILIDGAIGERSVFHETFAYYAHGVGLETAVLPRGWQERLVPICNANTRGNTGWCLEPHDLAVSKLVAGRPKDMDFLKALVSLSILDQETLAERLDQTELPSEDVRSIVGFRAKNIFL
jgi:hypothetical protein